MDFGDPTVRSLAEIVNAFSPTMVFYLVILLVADFVTGVFVAIQNNQFDWAKLLNVGKKNIFIAAAWGVAFVYSDGLGKAVYSLALAGEGASVVNNISALLGVNLTGIVGQLLTKGPGDSNRSSGG